MKSAGEPKSMEILLLVLEKYYIINRVLEPLRDENQQRFVNSCKLTTVERFGPNYGVSSSEPGKSTKCCLNSCGRPFGVSLTNSRTIFYLRSVKILVEMTGHLGNQ